VKSPYHDMTDHDLYRLDPDDGDGEGWLTKCVGTALVDMRILWWSPAFMASQYEVWPRYCKRGAVAVADMLSVWSVPREYAVFDTATDRWLEGPLVDMICPPHATATAVAESAAGGSHWMLRLLSHAWYDSLREPVVVPWMGNVVDRGVQRVMTDTRAGMDAVVVAQFWADILTDAHESIVDGYRKLGVTLDMCDEWPMLTDVAGKALSRQRGPTRSADMLPL